MWITTYASESEKNLDDEEINEEEIKGSDAWRRKQERDKKRKRPLVQKAPDLIIVSS